MQYLVRALTCSDMTASLIDGHSECGAVWVGDPTVLFILELRYVARCLHIRTVPNHVCRFQRPNTFEVCLMRRVCSRAHCFIDSSSLYNMFSLPFNVRCMFSFLFLKNESIALLTAMNFQDVELLQSIVRPFTYFGIPCHAYESYSLVTFCAPQPASSGPC